MARTTFAASHIRKLKMFLGVESTKTKYDYLIFEKASSYHVHKIDHFQYPLFELNIQNAWLVVTNLR